jgi:hypothetical protein
MSTASCFEEVTDSFILQVSAVSSPELLTEGDSDVDDHIDSSDSDDSDCNRPWVMRQHRTHVSSITGLIYYCTRLGLSSTVFPIV